MRWSLKIATVFGIPIRIHVTFLVLLAFVGLRSTSASPGALAGVPGVILVVMIFAGVLLHELGHSLVARKFGIGVDSITLWPIGGVASIRATPKSPTQELLIAIAGPAVSLVLGATLSGAALIFHPTALSSTNAFIAMLDTSYLARLGAINLVLAVFNLLPAFPMDGGRVLRAILWYRLGFQRATHYAAKTGQALAAAGFIFAIMHGDYWLSFIAMFIYFGAGAEGRAAEAHDRPVGMPVHQLMLTNLQTISPTESIENASLRVTASDNGQEDFPVFHQGELVGVLTRDNLLDAISRKQLAAVAGDFMTRQVVFCSPLDSAAAVFDTMNQQALPCVLVLQQNQLVGLITARQRVKVAPLGQNTEPSDSA